MSGQVLDQTRYCTPILGIESVIEFIKDVKRCGIEFEDGEDQSDNDNCLLTA